MFKHANTLETGDAVRRAGTEGKIASDSGKIVGADTENEQFSVKWADGTTTWHPPHGLEKDS